MKNLAAVCSLLVGLIVGVWAVPGCGRSGLDDANGPAGSGGTTGTPPTLGLPPSPGVFLCGLETCSTASQQCCLGVAASGGLGASCARLGSACAGAALQCDEPADCRVSASSAGSSVCCFGLDSSAATTGATGVSVGSRCESAASCAGLGHFILCATDSDCEQKGNEANGQVCCASVGIPTCQARCPGI